MQPRNPVQQRHYDSARRALAEIQDDFLKNRHAFNDQQIDAMGEALAALRKLIETLR
jgi:uncharacterized protein YfkK (UPF0435 family)